MSEDIKDIYLDWQCAGKLSDFGNDDKYKEIRKGKGIYLFVYEYENDNGLKYKKIIYVGTTYDSFLKRILKHRSHMEKGGFTIFKTEGNIYDLMCSDKNINEYYTKIIDCVNVWIPSTLKDGILWKRFKKNESSFQEYQEYVKNQYIKRLNIYVANISVYYNFKLIESKIQKSLKQKFNIGYYNSSQSWLGREEFNNEDVNNLNLISTNIPDDVDEETKILFEKRFPIS